MVFPAQGSGQSGAGDGVRGYAKFQRLATAQSIPNATLTLFNFDTEAVDGLEGCAVTTGASWKVTANRALKLTVKVDFRTSSNESLTPNNVHYAQIYKNGLPSDHGFLLVDAPGVAQSAAIYYLRGTSLPIELDAGDYVDIRFYQAKGSSVDWKGILELIEEY